MINELVIRLSDIGMKNFPEYFAPLKEGIRYAGLGVIFEVYVGRMILITLASFIAVFIHMLVMLTVFGRFPLWFSFPGSLMIASIISFIILIVFHSYPYQAMSTKRASIDANMPFALNHMTAVASSGVPPATIFRLLMGIKEYGQVSEESGLIVRNMETFGMDMTTAVKQVANTTSSDKFREFLFSVVSTIESGGDLKRFLKSVTQESMFEYKLRREKYLETLMTYADFYTAVLIAAPLFFISILSVMAMIGGNIMGMSIIEAMQLGIYAFIPLLNIVFLAFVHMTQPAV
jgi:flagellar protein FlaJ